MPRSDPRCDMYITPILHCCPALTPVDRAVVREFHCGSCTGIYCSRRLGNQLALPGHLSGHGITLYRPCREILAVHRPNTASKIQQSFLAPKTHESLFHAGLSGETLRPKPIGFEVSTWALVSTSRPGQLEAGGGGDASSSV